MSLSGRPDTGPPELRGVPVALPTHVGDRFHQHSDNRQENGAKQESVTVKARAPVPDQSEDQKPHVPRHEADDARSGRITVGGQHADADAQQSLDQQSSAEAPGIRERGTEESVPVRPSEDPDVETLIARVGRAARLGASAELLAAHPGLEPYRAQADRYLAEVYRGTPAGDRAATRVDASAKPANQEPEP